LRKASDKASADKVFGGTWADHVREIWAQEDMKGIGWDL